MLLRTLYCTEATIFHRTKSLQTYGAPPPPPPPATLWQITNFDVRDVRSERIR